MSDYICFSYKLDEDAKIELKEYFAPYSVKFLKEKLNINELDTSLLKEASENLEILKDCITGDFISIKSSDEIEDSPWISNESTVSENSLFDYYADLKFISALVNDKTYWTVRIGIATEIMKIVMDIFKINISILLSLKDFTKENENQFLEFIRKTVLQNGFLSKDVDIENLSEGLQWSQGVSFLIKDLCSHVTEYLEYICSSAEINDNCLQQLAEYFDKTSNLELRSKFVTNRNRNDDKNKGCFCIIKDVEKYYFSFSGEDYEKCDNYKLYKRLSDKVQEYLKTNILKTNAISWRNISLNTKSYGFYIDSKKSKCCFFDRKFMPYPFPLRYGCEKDLLEFTTIGSAYGCCERKIFASIQKESDYMKIYCRWSPCEKCFPAVIEQINLHSHFEFWAFAKDFETFKKNPCNKTLWKLIKKMENA